MQTDVVVGKVVAVCLVALWVGCGDSEGTGGTGGSGGSGGTGGPVGAGGEGGAGGSGEGGNGGSSPGRLYAFITVERWTRANEEQVTMGAFVPFHTGQPAPRYTPIDDNCFVHYETDWSGTGLTPPTTGTITIDGTAAGEPVTWSGDGFDLSPDGFDAGDELTVYSTGGDVPAFTFTGVVPEVPTLTSHDNTVPGPSTIFVARTVPFELTWEPVEGEIFVLLLQGDQPAFTIRRGIQCVFPGQDGAAAVPAAAVAELLTSTEVDTTNFYFGLVDRDRREFANIDVDFRLWNARQTRVTVE